MPTIAFVITDLEPGGAEKALVELATRIDCTRFNPIVCSLQPLPTDPVRSLVPRLLEANIEVHSLDARSSWKAWQSVSRLTRWLRDRSPALVQTFMFHANMLGRVAAWRAGIKHVVSGIRVAEHERTSRLWIERWTEGLVEHHVCVSQAVAEFSQSRGGLSREKISVIPNGIDPAQYDRAQPADLQKVGIRSGQKAVTFVGRLDSQKGLLPLVQHAHQWLAQLPQYDLLIVGQGPLEDSLRQFVASSTISDRVHFAGWRSDVPEILRASAALVLPSLWEGMPNVVLEAMASGLPIVASDAEGVRELLGENSQAQLASIGDPSGFASKLAALLADDDLAANCAQENRRRAREIFDIAYMVSAYEKLYARLLAS